jgi:hypothetical protein
MRAGTSSQFHPDDLLVYINLRNERNYVTFDDVVPSDALGRRPCRRFGCGG